MRMNQRQTESNDRRASDSSCHPVTENYGIQYVKPCSRGECSDFGRCHPPTNNPPQHQDGKPFDQHEEVVHGETKFHARLSKYHSFADAADFARNYLLPRQQDVRRESFVKQWRSLLRPGSNSLHTLPVRVILARLEGQSAVLRHVYATRLLAALKGTCG